MDTNLVIPRSIDRTDVIFDFYFDDVSTDASARNRIPDAVPGEGSRAATSQLR